MYDKVYIKKSDLQYTNLFQSNYLEEFCKIMDVSSLGSKTVSIILRNDEHWTMDVFWSELSMLDQDHFETNIWYKIIAQWARATYFEMVLKFDMDRAS